MMAGEWTAEMTRALISVLGQANILCELDGVVRNRTMFERIFRELKEMGIHRTSQQCRTKIKTARRNIIIYTTTSPLSVITFNEVYISTMCSYYHVQDAVRGSRTVLGGMDTSTC